MTEPTSAYPEHDQYPPEVVEPPVQPAPAPKPKKTALVIVSIVAVLFLAAAATFGGLYFTEKKHSQALADTSSAQAKELSKANDDVKKAKADLATAEDARKKAEEAVGNATKCQEAARTIHEAAMAGDTTKLDQAVIVVFGLC